MNLRPSGYEPDSLIGNLDATLGEQILHIAVTEGKPEIQPDSSLDYFCRKPMSAVADLVHSRKLLATHS